MQMLLRSGIIHVIMIHLIYTSQISSRFDVLRDQQVTGASVYTNYKVRSSLECGVACSESDSCNAASVVKSAAGGPIHCDLVQDPDEGILTASPGARVFMKRSESALPRSMITGCTSSPASYTSITCEHAYDGDTGVGRGSAFMVAAGSDSGSSGWLEVTLATPFNIVGVVIINRCSNTADQAKDVILTVGHATKNAEFPCLSRCFMVEDSTINLDTHTVSDTVTIALLNKCFIHQNTRVGITEFNITIYT